MQIGIDSFAAVVTDPQTGQTLAPADRLGHLLEEIETADRSGIDIFGIGEHHRPEYLDSAPTLILAAAAARTRRIRLVVHRQRDDAVVGAVPSEHVVGHVVISLYP